MNSGLKKPTLISIIALKKDLVELHQLNDVRVVWLKMLGESDPDTDLHRFASGEFQRLERRFNPCFERCALALEQADQNR